MRRRGDHPYFDTAPNNHFPYFFCRLNDQTARQRHTNLLRIRIKGSCKQITSFSEIVILGQALPQVAHAHNAQGPVPVCSKNLLYLIQKIPYLITNSPNTKFSKVSQIFSDLRRVHTA